VSGVLVVLDESGQAIARGVALARERGESVTGLFVYERGWNVYIGHDWLSGSNARATFLEYVEEHEKAAEAELKARFLAEAAAAGVAARFEAICCDDLEHLTDAVIRQAREGGYAQIVCADPLTRGLSLRRGGTAALLRGAPCPVVLAGQAVAA
jgi:nucleotide-binding universal stress UspA family protein